MVAKRLGETVIFSEQGEFKQILAWDRSLSDSLSLAFFQQQKRGPLLSKDFLTVEDDFRFGIWGEVTNE